MKKFVSFMLCLVFSHGMAYAQDKDIYSLNVENKRAYIVNDDLNGDGSINAMDSLLSYVLGLLDAGIDNFGKNIIKVGSPKHTLTYIVDGEEYKRIEIYEGESVTPEAAPTKEHYTFSGWSEIPATMPVKDVIVTGSFKEITGIISVINDSPGTLIYDMQGRRIDHLKKGLNIIRMNDGKTKKVIVN